MACFSALIGSFWSILAVHFLYSCKVGWIKRLKPNPLRGAVQFYRIRAVFLPAGRYDPPWLTRIQFHCATEGGNYLQTGRGDFWWKAGFEGWIGFVLSEVPILRCALKLDLGHPRRGLGRLSRAGPPAEKRGKAKAGTEGAVGPRGLPPFAKCTEDEAPRRHIKNPGPQMRGTGGHPQRGLGRLSRAGPPAHVRSASSRSKLIAIRPR